jgi:hypothetical protein
MFVFLMMSFILCHFLSFLLCQIDPPCPYVSSVFVFPTDVIYVSRGVVHPTDHYKIGVFCHSGGSTEERRTFNIVGFINII